ncbi:MAG: hypothetical protein A2Y15_08710 [Clostridiales bacterium GWF2_36_10]|nr:MAG: hypothetical protein A2Y15_08710 [Clostridiales bacterium GWF2_36_10]HAN20424.1 hypothetical protein [Clostridiales bacterium]
MGANFSVNGFSDIIDRLSEMAYNVDEVVDQSLIEAATTMQLEAKKLLKTPTIHHIGDNYFSAPSARDGDNSKIIKNMKVSKVVHGWKPGVVHGSKQGHGTYIKVYNSDPNAQLTEYGHSGNIAPAHPFLAPAFERKKKEAYKIIEDNLIGALSK